MHTVLKRVGAAAGVVAFLVGAQIVAAEAASAAPCSTNYVCLYKDINYGGSQRNLANLSRSDVGINLTGGLGFNDQMSSWQSRRPNYSRWYFDIYGGGSSRCMNPNWNVSRVTSAENDKASYVLLYGTSTRC